MIDRQALADMEGRFAATCHSYFNKLTAAHLSDEQILEWLRSRRPAGRPTEAEAWKERSTASVFVLQILDLWLRTEDSWSAENWFDVFVPQSFVLEADNRVQLEGKTVWGVGRNGGQRQGPVKTVWQFAADSQLLSYKVLFLDRASPEGVSFAPGAAPFPDGDEDFAYAFGRSVQS